MGPTRSSCVTPSVMYAQSMMWRYGRSEAKLHRGLLLRRAPSPLRVVSCFSVFTVVCCVCTPHQLTRGNEKQSYMWTDPDHRVRPVALVTRTKNIALAKFSLLLQLRSSPRGRCPVARLQICVVRSHPDRRSISRSSVWPRRTGAETQEHAFLVVWETSEGPWSSGKQPNNLIVRWTSVQELTSRAYEPTQPCRLFYKRKQAQ